jgi:hypothetical protein
MSEDEDRDFYDIAENIAKKMGWGIMEVRSSDSKNTIMPELDKARQEEIANSIAPNTIYPGVIPVMDRVKLSCPECTYPDYIWGINKCNPGTTE